MVAKGFDRVMVFSWREVRLIGAMVLRMRQLGVGVWPWVALLQVGCLVGAFGLVQGCSNVRAGRSGGDSVTALQCDGLDLVGWKAELAAEVAWWNLPCFLFIYSLLLLWNFCLIFPQFVLSLSFCFVTELLSKFLPFACYWFGGIKEKRL